MKKDIRHLYLSAQERKVIIHSLNALRNELLSEGKYTDFVDEILCKAVNAKVEKLRIKYV